MELLKILFTSVLSVVALYLLAKLMGEKQISQLSFFDYIVGISIGSIAAEMATNLEDSILNPLLAMIVYAVLALLISVVTNKSHRLRSFLTGRPVLLMDGGVIFRRNLKRARLDLGDFLALCRIAGYFDLSEIQSAVLEHTGCVSFLPAAATRPATVSDLKLSPAPSQLTANVIMDGRIMADSLRRCGRDEAWLLSQLKTQGYSTPKEIFLATLSGDNRLALYPNTPKSPESVKIE